MKKTGIPVSQTSSNQYQYQYQSNLGVISGGSSGQPGQSAVKKHTQEDFSRKGSAWARHPFTEGNSMQQSPQGTTSVSPPAHSHVQSLLQMPSPSGLRKITNQVSQAQQQQHSGRISSNQSSFLSFQNATNPTDGLSSLIHDNQSSLGSARATQITGIQKMGSATQSISGSIQSYSNQYKNQMSIRMMNNNPSSSGMGKISSAGTQVSNVSSSSSSGSSTQAKNSQKVGTANVNIVGVQKYGNSIASTAGMDRYQNRIDQIRSGDDASCLQEMGKLKKGITCLNKLIQNVGNETYSSASQSHRQQISSQQNGGGLQQSSGSKTSNGHRMSSPAPISTAVSHRQSLAAAAQTVSAITASLEESSGKNYEQMLKKRLLEEVQENVSIPPGGNSKSTRGLQAPSNESLGVSNNPATSMATAASLVYKRSVGSIAQDRVFNGPSHPTENLEKLASRLSEIAMNLSSPDRKINSATTAAIVSARNTASIPGAATSSVGVASSMKSSRHASGNLNSGSQSNEQSLVQNSSTGLRNSQIGSAKNSSSGITQISQNQAEFDLDQQLAAAQFNNQFLDDRENYNNAPHYSSLSTFSPGSRVIAAESFSRSEMYKKPQPAIRKNSNGRGVGNFDTRTGVNDYKALVKERPTTSGTIAGHKSEILSQRYTLGGSSSNRTQQLSSQEMLAQKQKKDPLGNNSANSGAAGAFRGGKMAKKKRQEMKSFRHFSSIDFQNTGGDSLSQSWMNSAQTRSSNANLKKTATVGQTTASSITTYSQSKANLLSLQEKIQLMQANHLLSSLSIHPNTHKIQQNYANTIDYDALGDRSEDVPSSYDRQLHHMADERELASYQEENDSQPIVPRSSMQAAMQLEERLRKLESSPLEGPNSLALKQHKIGQQVKSINNQNTESSSSSLANPSYPSVSAASLSAFTKAFPNHGLVQTDQQQLSSSRMVTRTSGQSAKLLKPSGSGAMPQKTTSKSPVPSTLQSKTGSQSYRKIDAGSFSGASRQVSNKIGDQLIKERRKQAEQTGSSASVRDSILNGGSIHVTSVSLREPSQIRNSNSGAFTTSPSQVPDSRNRIANHDFTYLRSSKTAAAALSSSSSLLSSSKAISMQPQVSKATTNTSTFLQDHSQDRITEQAREEIIVIAQKATSGSEALLLRQQDRNYLTKAQMSVQDKVDSARDLKLEEKRLSIPVNKSTKGAQYPSTIAPHSSLLTSPGCTLSEPRSQNIANNPNINQGELQKPVISVSSFAIDAIQRSAPKPANQRTPVYTINDLTGNQVIQMVPTKLAANVNSVASQNVAERHSLSELLNPMVGKRKSDLEMDDSLAGTINNIYIGHAQRQMNYKLSNDDEDRQAALSMSQQGINPLIQRDFTFNRVKVDNLIDSRDDFLGQNLRERLNLKQFGGSTLTGHDQATANQQANPNDDGDDDAEEDDDEELQFFCEDDEEECQEVLTSEQIALATESINPVRIAQHTEGRHRINCLAIQEKTGMMISGSHDYMLRIYQQNDVNSIQVDLLQTIKHRRWVTSLAFLGNSIVSGSADGLIRIFNQQSNYQFEMSTFIKAHNGSVTALDPMKNQIEQTKVNQLASSGVDGVVQIWDVEKAASVQSYDLHTTVSHLSWDFQRHLLISLDSRYLLAQDIRSPYRSPTLRVVNDDFTCLVASDIGILIAAGQDSSGSVHGITSSLNSLDFRALGQAIVPVLTSKRVKRYAAIQQLGVSATYCALGSDEGVELVNLSGKSPSQFIDPESRDVLALAFDEKNSKLFAGQRNHAVVEYQLC